VYICRPLVWRPGAVINHFDFNYFFVQAEMLLSLQHRFEGQKDLQAKGVILLHAMDLNITLLYLTADFASSPFSGSGTSSTTFC
jgi:hypothetical protein